MIRQSFIRILTVASAVFSTTYILAAREMTVKSPKIPSLEEPQKSPANGDTQVTTPAPRASTEPPNIVLNNVYPFRYIINNNRSCHTDEKLKLVMVVVSAPMYFETRLAIRRTWGVAASRKDVSIIFLLGGTNDTEVQKKLVDEDKLYRDIVQEDFVDTYRNLTLKSVALLRWVNLFCMNAQFAMKVDDDTFVNVPNLLDFLEKKKDEKKVIYGKVRHKAQPIRNKRSKWMVSEEDFKGDIYPNYTGGFSYAISIDSVQGLLDAAMKLKIIPMEDVFITGMCAEYANVSRIHDVHFQVITDVAAPCAFRNLIAANDVPPSSLFIVWWYTNYSLFETCEIPKAKQTCTQKSRHVLVEFAGLLIKKIVKS